LEGIVVMLAMGSNGWQWVVVVVVTILIVIDR
jgi:type IV secretory pathway VirB2 component (pilin)